MSHFQFYYNQNWKKQIGDNTTNSEKPNSFSEVHWLLCRAFEHRFEGSMLAAVVSEAGGGDIESTLDHTQHWLADCRAWRPARNKPNPSWPRTPSATNTYVLICTQNLYCHSEFDFQDNIYIHIYKNNIFNILLSKNHNSIFTYMYMKLIDFN